MFDVIIVGAGPAGLSAALVLGRCRRRVLVCDTGRPRNAASRALHAFLTRDGIDPAELLRIGWEQLRPYDTVELRSIEVTNAKRIDGRFEVAFGDGTCLFCRRLLLATGLVDPVPPIEGLQALYGRSVFHCPYCDGWEVRDQPLAAYGKGDHGVGLALELLGWSRDLVLCTDGPAKLSAHDREHLSRNGIAVREESIARLEGADGILERVVFTDGTALPRRSLFFSTHWRQRSDLPAKVGCKFTAEGAVETDEYEATNIAGLFVAGDAERHGGMAIIAAAEGARAACAINAALLKEDLA
jgi:thioredoxin reductase